MTFVRVRAQGAYAPARREKADFLAAAGLVRSFINDTAADSRVRRRI